jgi:superfamily II DNA or RNA helicase
MYRSPVVCASVQTLNAGMGGMGRMTRFNPDDFDTLIVDEAHHATAASYRRKFLHFEQNENLRILGVTATTDRGDKQALGQVFESVAFKYGMRESIDDGYLVPIEQRFVVIEGLDFSKIRTRMGDLNGKELDLVMREEKHIHEVASPTVELTKGMKVIVFAVTIAHAERLCEVINRYEPGQAVLVHGGTPKEDRRTLLRRYSNGEFRFLVNVGVFTEGFDEPGVEAIVVARPTKSRALYTQMIGRGTRTLPGVIDGIDAADKRRAAIEQSDKRRVLILDFVGNSGQHKLVTTADIMQGKHSLKAVERVRKAAEQGAVNVMDALDEAEEQVQLEEAEILARQIEREKEEARETAKRLKVTAETSYKTTKIDPFDLFDLRPPERSNVGDAPATQKQVAMLDRLGVAKVSAESMTTREAETLLRENLRRMKAGLASYKQVKFLGSKNINAKNMSKQAAGEWMGKIVNNGYRPVPVPVPLQLHPDTSEWA